MKITVVLNKIGDKVGASKSGLDLLLACNQSKHQTSVVYNRGCKIPKYVDGIKLNNLKAHRAPKNLNLKKGMGLKKFLNWTVGKLCDKFRNKKINSLSSNIVIVNGTASHAHFKKNDYSDRQLEVLVVRESPRHFQFKKNAKNPLGNAIRRMNQYRKYIFVSSNVMDEWKEILSLKDEQCTYIPNCAEETNITEIMQQSKSKVKEGVGFSDQEFNIVCVASIQYRKGQDIIIEMFEKLKSTIPNLKMHFIGSRGSRSYYRKLIRHENYKKYKKNIKFWGTRKDANKLIYAGDLFLFPTRAEAFPRVILEAMALKTPIVSSDVDGIPEMLNESNSMLFSHASYEGMINGVKTLYNDKTLGEQLAEKAHKTYWERFSREKQISKMRNYLIALEAKIESKI